MSVARKLLVEKSQQDINCFIEFAFKLKQSDCHRKIQTHISSNRRALILAPANHGKTQSSLARVIWDIGRNPDTLYKLVCSTDDVAKERLSYIKEQIERNDRLLAVFPHLRKSPYQENWGKQSMTINRRIISKDPTIDAAGVLTTGTGGRADKILFDDIVDRNNAIKYPTQREQVVNAVRTVWIPMLGPEGTAWYIATRWHEKDATAWAEKNTEWKMLDLSLKKELKVPIWPERWPIDKLLQMKAEIGEIDFEMRYCNIIMPDNTRLIPEAFFRYLAEVPQSQNLRILSFDFASSSGSSDSTADAVIDVDFATKTFVVSFVGHWEKLGFEQKCDLILSEIARWKPDVTIGEANGMQVDIVTDERIAGRMMPIQSRISKRERVKLTRVWYERGAVAFVERNTVDARAQLLAFTGESGKKDDMVDALTQGLQYGIEKLGKSFNPEDVKTSGIRVFSATKMSGETEESKTSGRSPRSRIFGGGSARW